MKGNTPKIQAKQAKDLAKYLESEYDFHVFLVSTLPHIL